MNIIKRIQLKNLYISSKDKDIYESIMLRKHLCKESIKDLYKLNLYLSQELYIVVNVIETLYKNKLHQKMTEIEGTENWFNIITWRPKEYDILKDAARKKLVIKSPVRILDELTLKFWLQTFDVYYDSILFKRAIQYLFPNYKGAQPLKRSSLKLLFTEMQNYRNIISHHHVIIHEEHKLLNYYHKFLRLIYWMDADYYKLIVHHSRFLRYYCLLITSSYDAKGILWYIWRHFRRFFMKYIWKIIHIFYKEDER